MRNEELLLHNLIRAERHEAQARAPGGLAYTAARSAALRNWRPHTGSANADTLYDLDRLRPQSRDLARNDPIACGAKLTAVTGAIGSGLSLQPKPHRAFLRLSDADAEAWEDNTRMRFEFWANSDACDAERKSNFYALQARARNAALESGDCFILMPRLSRPGRTNALCLQLIEADRVSNPYGAPDSDTLNGGIQYDDTGAPVSIWVCNRHPGDIYSTKTLDWKEIPVFGANSGRRNVIYLPAIEQTLRPAQSRCPPWLAPVIQPLKQLGEFTDAELQSTVNAAIFSMFIEMEHDAFQATFSAANDPDGSFKQSYFNQCLANGEVQGGRNVRMLPGEKIHGVQSSHPNAGLDPFMAAILKRVGAALGIPFEVLILSFNASYSAARASLLRAWQMFKLWRASDAAALCDPVYQNFLAEEIRLGRINAPGFFVNDDYLMAWSNAHWVGDGPGSIDPQREVAAAKERVALTISTLEAESEAYDGLPWKDKAATRAKEQAILQDGGLVAPPAPAAPGQPALPGASAEIAELKAMVQDLAGAVALLTEALA